MLQLKEFTNIDDLNEFLEREDIAVRDVVVTERICWWNFEVYSSYPVYHALFYEKPQDGKKNIIDTD